jgi:hypothetical protein
MSYSNSPFKKNLSLNKKADLNEIRLDSQSFSRPISFRDNFDIQNSQNSNNRRDTDIFIENIQKSASFVVNEHPNMVQTNDESVKFHLLRRSLVSNQLLADNKNQLNDQNSEENNPEFKFAILSIKKLIYDLVQENAQLENKIKQQEDKDPQYCQMIKSLSYKIEELNMKEKLDFERPSDVSNEDLDQIDRELLLIDESLESAMGSKGQENFVQQVMDKNKEFFHIADKYSHSLQELEDATQQLKMMLVNVNSVNFS